MSEIIYKIVPEDLWQAAKSVGFFEGSPVDRSDGFIHFSTGAQVRETAARHFAGQHGLILVAVAADRLGPALRFEPSRGGALFPHLYAAMPLSAVVWEKPMPLDGSGLHVIPELD